MIAQMNYCRTRIYQISADCEIYSLYTKSDIYEKLVCTIGTENFIWYIRLSDKSEFYCPRKRGIRMFECEKELQNILTSLECELRSNIQLCIYRNQNYYVWGRQLSSMIQFNANEKWKTVSIFWRRRSPLANEQHFIGMEQTMWIYTQHQDATFLLKRTKGSTFKSGPKELECDSNKLCMKSRKRNTWSLKHVILLVTTNAE